MSRSIGPEGPSRFCTTHWSVVLTAGHGASGDAREAIEELCATYWRPLFIYIRRRGHGVEDARDLTQGFFAGFLARDDLRTVDPAKGRFRSYLLGAVKHFLANERAREGALKRGGGARPLPLPVGDEELEAVFEPRDERSPEAEFERGWALALLELVLTRLRAEQEERGHGALFEHLAPTLAGGAIAGGHAAVAADLGLTPVAVKVAAHRLRKRYRELLLTEVARTVERPQDVEDEIRRLFLAVGGQESPLGR